MCGSAARRVTGTKNRCGSIPRIPVRRTGDPCTVPLTAVPVELRRIHRASRYISDERISITVTSAYGSGLLSSSVSPLRICTGVTRLYPNISGVPSSVKLQISTMLPPARIPGFSSGSVIRNSLRKNPAPMFRAASRIAGSMFPSDDTRFRYRIGYRCSASIRQIDQNRPSPPRKSIRSNPPRTRIVLSTP